MLWSAKLLIAYCFVLRYCVYCLLLITCTCACPVFPALPMGVLMMQVGHGDFVVDWPGDAQLSPNDVDDWRMMQAAAISGGHQAEGAVWRGEGGHDGTSSSSSHDFRSRQQQRQQLLAQLPNYCRDIAMLVTGQCQANFVHHHQHLQQHSRGGDTQLAQGGLRYYRRQATADQVMNAVDAAVLVQPAELN